MSQLGHDAPLSHRAMHALSAWGLVGAPTLWSHLGALPHRGEWRTGDVSFEVLPDTPGVADKLLYKGLYERAEMAVVSHVVNPGDRCVDVGANVGMYTAFMAGLVGATGTVIACEPSPVALTRLRPLVARLPQVALHETAVGDSPGTVSMSVAAGDSMHSTMRGAAVGEMITVPVRRLADVVSDHPVAFVKVDVEGYEAKVIEGMGDLFERQQVGVCMLEAEPSYGALDWVAALEDIPGYDVRRLEHRRRGCRWVPRLAKLADRLDGTVFVLRR